MKDILELGEWWHATHPEAAAAGHRGPDPRRRRLRRSATRRTRTGSTSTSACRAADGVEGPADPGTYDRELTQQLVDRLVAVGAQYVFVGPSLDVHGPPGIVMTWPNHDDHVHWRIPDPDGTGN